MPAKPAEKETRQEVARRFSKGGIRRSRQLKKILELEPEVDIYRKNRLPSGKTGLKNPEKTDVGVRGAFSEIVGKGWQIERKKDGVIGQRRGYRVRQYGMKLARTGEKEATAGNRIPRLVTQKRTGSLKEKVDFILGSGMGMIPTMPGKPVAAGKPIHKHRVFDLHHVNYRPENRKISISDIKNQNTPYRKRNLPFILYSRTTEAVR
jgi:hypothetical protein